MPPAGPRGMAIRHVGVGSRHHPAADGGGGYPYRTWRLAGLTIDFFSKERGVIYQQELDTVQIEKTV